MPDDALEIESTLLITINLAIVWRRVSRRAMIYDRVYRGLQYLSVNPSDFVSAAGNGRCVRRWTVESTNQLSCVLWALFGTALGAIRAATPGLVSYLKIGINSESTLGLVFI